MATEDFEIRFAKIKEKLHTFHGNFLQENTINILNPKQLKELLPKLQQIYDTLMHFLAHCLDNNGCDSSTIRFIVSTNAGGTNARGRNRYTKNSDMEYNRTEGAFVTGWNHVVSLVSGLNQYVCKIN